MGPLRSCGAIYHFYSYSTTSQKKCHIIISTLIVPRQKKMSHYNCNMIVVHVDWQIKIFLELKHTDKIIVTKKTYDNLESIHCNIYLTNNNNKSLFSAMIIYLFSSPKCNPFRQHHP